MTPLARRFLATAGATREAWLRLWEAWIAFAAWFGAIYQGPALDNTTVDADPAFTAWDQLATLRELPGVSTVFGERPVPEAQVVPGWEGITRAWQNVHPSSVPLIRALQAAYEGVPPLDSKPAQVWLYAHANRVRSPAPPASDGSNDVGKLIVGGFILYVLSRWRR